MVVRTLLRPFPGLLCTITGLLVVILNRAMPEKMREAFSIGGMEEDADGYLSSLVWDGVATSPFTSKGRVVSWRYLPCQ